MLKKDTFGIQSKIEISVCEKVKAGTECGVFGSLQLTLIT